MPGQQLWLDYIKPYIHDLSFNEMIESFEKSGIIDVKTDPTFTPFMLNFLKRYNYTFAEKTKEALNVDKILSKRIMHHLNIFFDKFGKNTNTTTIKSKSKTKTNKSKEGKSKTMKHKLKTY
jgi:predicted nucleotide-binding protein (sugar kinase/HSP70/actin superfamily)